MGVGKRSAWYSVSGILALAALLGGVLSSADAAEFYVSPRAGSDSYPGTHELPFATIERAQQAVRRVNAHMSGDIIVWLRQGIHRVPRPLMFTAEDSGTGGFHVRYRAYPGEKPMLSGGTRLTGWQVSDAAKNIYVASARGQTFRQLYVGSTRGIRSRHPDLDASPNFVRARSILEDPRDGHVRLDVETSSLGPLLPSVLGSPSYHRDLEIVMYYAWNMSRLRILRGAAVPGTSLYRLVVMAPDGQVETIKSRLLPGSRFEARGQAFYLENSPVFLNQPNEWYLDQANDRVYFRAPDAVTSAADVEALGVVVPTGSRAGDNETFISIRGGGTPSRPVRNLSFEGLIFAHTNWLGPSESGFVGSWSTRRYVASPSDPYGVRLDSAPAAVDIHDTEGIAFVHNVFQDLGGSAIRVDGATKDFRAVGNAFLEVNGNGIETSGSYQAGPKQGVVVESNLFRVIGWDYHGIAVRASGVAGLKIRHNEIDFTTHAAIQTRGGVGPGTGALCYGSSVLSGAVGNEISANTIERPARRVFDMGAIYSSCKQTLTIADNTITDARAPAWYAHLPTYSVGGIGVYLDHFSQGVTVSGNRIRKVLNPFHLNCESGNTIRNNRTDLAPGTEDSATRRICDAQRRMYGPSTTVVVDSNSATRPASLGDATIGMRLEDKTFLAWLSADVNREFADTTPLVARPLPAVPQPAGRVEERRQPS